MGDNQCRFDYQKLETAIKTLVEKKLLDANAIMADSSDRPKNVPTFVVATKGLHADGPPTLFRSYQCTGYSADRCTIWEAVCATSAAPTFFKPIKIDIPPPGGTFVDGGLTHNNPAELALSEAQRIWDTVKRFCLVSLGTGRLKSVRVVDVRSNAVPGGEASRTVRSSSLRPSKRIRLQETSSEGLSALTKIGEMCVQLATSSEHTHQRLLRLSQSGDPDKRFPYHRFNVERDMHEIELQEWSQMEAIGAHTATYMEEGERESKRNHCIEDLTNPAPIQCISTPNKLKTKYRSYHTSVAFISQTFFDAVREKSSLHWTQRASDSSQRETPRHDSKKVQSSCRYLRNGRCWKNSTCYRIRVSQQGKVPQHFLDQFSRPSHFTLRIPRHRPRHRMYPQSRSRESKAGWDGKSSFVMARKSTWMVTGDGQYG